MSDCIGTGCKADAMMKQIVDLRAERDALAALLPGVHYMDPPDGGDVPLDEQMRRMAADAARYRWLRGNVPESSSRWSRWRIEHWASPGPTWSDVRSNDLDAAIDAALTKDKP